MGTSWLRWRRSLQVPLTDLLRKAVGGALPDDPAVFEDVDAIEARRFP
jgi:hypothetical protein